MKISPLYSVRSTASKNSSIKKIASYNTPNNNTVSFMGEYYSSGYYSDDEIKYAKQYLGQENWQQEYRDKRLEFFMKDMDERELFNDNTIEGTIGIMFWPIVIPGYMAEYKIKKISANKKINEEIRRISNLMVDLNNEHLEELNRKKIDLQHKQKNEQRKLNIQKCIYNNFLQLYNVSKNDSDIKVPTAVLITGSTMAERDETINWTKKQIDSRAIFVDLPEDEDDALYRIETEIDYAKDYYEKNQARSVLFVNNFDKFLNSKQTSSRTIGDLKEILADISLNDFPLTIIFQTENTENIDNAFISNKIRIPCTIDLDKII